MKIGLRLLTVSLSLFIFSCSTKEHHSETSSKVNDEWPEMDAFHMTMAEVFHPLKDSGNVEPATRLMGQLTDEADKWAAAPLPKKVNNDEMKERLQKLKTDLRALTEQISNGVPEDQVGTKLYTIHDQFHEIMEVWHGGGVHKHQEKH